MSSKNSRAARNAHAKASQEFKTYDTSAIRPKKSKAPYIIGIIILAIIIAIVVLFLCSCSSRSVEPLPTGQEAVVVVESGEGARDVAQSLLDKRLITNKDEFLELVNSRDAAGSLIPGTYSFVGGMSQEELLDSLLEGPSSTGVTITIPEGYKREDIAKAINDATSGRISKSDFMIVTENASDYARQFDFLEDVGDNSLEGFLFPKTYTITASDDAKSVAVMMLNQFKSETQTLDWSYPESLGLSQYDAVKLASIVEKESNLDSMPTIASVFYNRLKSDRPYLESDATTAYEVGHDPTADEVHANTPYSTYTNPGLPPTPICNPSINALLAVCMPETTDYMFFFTNSDGTHDFSVTYDQHQQAIG